MSSLEVPHPSKRDSSPWRRERDRIMRLLHRVASNEEGPVQAVAIEDPPGYGAGRLLDMLYSAFAARDANRSARLPPQHDAISDWPSLAIEILNAAHVAGASHGAPRNQMQIRRNEFGAIAFRDEVDDALRRAFERYGRLTLFIPKIDQLLKALEDQDHWAFRNVLQTQPLAVVASASPGWRPTRDQAFYEFFRRTRLKGYEESDLAALAKLFCLPRKSASQLRECHQKLSGRPALMEAAATALAVDADTATNDLLRHVALINAPFLHDALARLASQARLVLAECVNLGTPVTSGALAQATSLASGAVSTQLSRLEEAGMLAPDRREGRKRRYDFIDPVVGILYRELAASPMRPKSNGSAKKTL